MLDPITTTPDDLMDAPVHSIADRAADCIDRLRRLIALPPSTATDEIIDRERDLIRVRSVAVRVRAASVATYLRAAYGADVDAAMVSRDPCLTCYACRLLAGAYLEPPNE